MRIKYFWIFLLLSFETLVKLKVPSPGTPVSEWTPSPPQKRTAARRSVTRELCHQLETKPYRVFFTSGKVARHRARALCCDRFETRMNSCCVLHHPWTYSLPLKLGVYRRVSSSTMMKHRRQGKWKIRNIRCGRLTRIIFKLQSSYQ
jgi:hypothetical protein